MHAHSALLLVHGAADEVDAGGALGSVVVGQGEANALAWFEQWHVFFEHRVLYVQVALSVIEANCVALGMLK